MDDNVRSLSHILVEELWMKKAWEKRRDLGGAFPDGAPKNSGHDDVDSGERT